MKPITQSVLFICLILLGFIPSVGLSQTTLKVAVAGLAHDHVHSLLREYQGGQIDIIGIAESDINLARRYQNAYQLANHLFFDSVEEMLQHVKPDVVLAYNAIAEHVDVAEVCLPLGIPLIVEKPLATTVAQANRIAELSERYDTAVLTNYETTWYPSNHTLKRMLEADRVGHLKKVIVKDGHQGPREIGCSDAFLSWLTDPDRNGGGALIDFGCYGANLLTWLKNGERPVAVTAVTRQLKPDIYPRVDDDATIVLEYADGTTGIIQASWDWSYNIKDIHVYGERGSLHAVDATTLIHYTSPAESKQESLDTLKYSDQFRYFRSLLEGDVVEPFDLSSLENNRIVVEILDAARRSATQGQRVEMNRQ